MSEERLFTANRFLAVPDILKSRCGILDISFVYSLYRAVIELHGSVEEPFLEPVIFIDGKPVDLSKAEWEQQMHWIPAFNVSERNLQVSSRIFPALAHRGFVWLLELTSEAENPLNIDLGWKGHWKETDHVVNVSKPMTGERIGAISSRYDGIPFIEFRGTAPLFAVAFEPSEPMKAEITSDAHPDKVISSREQGEAVARRNEGIRYSLTTSITLEPGQTRTIALYVGIGLEEISAVASASDLKHHTWQELLSDLYHWLESHKLNAGDEQLNRILNKNSLYNFFFSEAVTLDTEELVLVTARSSRYQSCAAYWDRDAMLWSFPAVLQIEPVQARRMIEYALTVQLRNVGVRSRFIDGVALEPGFELDELCAPIYALQMYVRAAGDMSILFDRRVQSGVNRIHKILMSKKHDSVALFETMLMPNDKAAKYPYLTYNNVLAWRALRNLQWMYELIHDMDRSEDNKILARQVHQAIMSNCIVEGPFGPMFAWSVDLNGNYELRDEPAGSLQLLSWLEFCTPDLPAYRNTVQWIHSSENPYSFHDAPFAAPGTEHQNQPSILSVANDLLTGRVDHALDFLRRARMDDGIACESVDKETGRVATGPAFASCAGYLAFALGHALGASILGPEPEPSDRLYEPPPPEIRDTMESPELH